MLVGWPAAFNYMEDILADEWWRYFEADVLGGAVLARAEVVQMEDDRFPSSAMSFVRRSLSHQAM